MLIQQEKTDLFSLLRPIKQPKIWAYLAWVDTVNQYRRTLLGPLWILLSLIAGYFLLNILTILLLWPRG